VIGVTRRLGTVVSKAGMSEKTPELPQELKALEVYHTEFEMTWPFLVGEDDATNVRYGEMGVPMTVIIDKRGTIRAIKQGYRADQDLQFVAKLLEEK
jgi:hypothetical protein